MKDLISKYFFLCRDGAADGGSGASSGSETPPASTTPPPGETGEAGASSETPPADGGASSGGEGDGSATASTSPPENQTKEQKEDWRDRRIAQLTAKLNQSKQAPVVTPAVETPAPGGTPALDPTADFARRVDEAANGKLAAQNYANQCNKAAIDGRAKYGDDAFNTNLRSLHKLIDQTDPNEVAAYDRFLRAAIETEKPEDLIFTLGSDLTKAQKIFEMNPVKMAVELTKMALAAPEVEGASATPKPIRPVGGGSGDHAPVRPSDTSRADTLSTAEWMRRREAEVKAARG